MKYKIVKRLHRGEALVRYIDGTEGFVYNPVQYQFDRKEEKKFQENIAKHKKIAIMQARKMLFI